MFFRRWGSLPWILTSAFVLRLLLFTGIQGVDDTNYAMQAYLLPTGEIAPGTELFAARIGFVAPLWLLFATIGVNDVSLVAMPMAASMLLVILAWRLGRELGGDRLGTVAALLVAVYPLDVYNATTALLDLPQASVAALALYLLWRVEQGRTHAIGGAIAAGLLLGLAHLIKETAFLYWMATAPWFLARRNWRHLGVALAAFVAVIAAEMAAYAIAAGDAFYRFGVIATRQPDTQIIIDGPIRARAIELVNVLFNPEHGSLVMLGPMFWLAVPGLLIVLVRDLRRWGWIVLWLTSLVLALAFWPETIQPFRPAASLHLRFFTCVTLPLVLLAGRTIVDLPMRWRPSLGWASLAVVAAPCLLFAALNHEDAVRGRAGAEWAHGVLARYPDAEVVTDPRTMYQLMYVGRYRAPYRLRLYQPDDPPPRPGTLLLDNERWVKAHAMWDDSPPPSWWRGTALPRTVVGVLDIPGRWRLRGTRLPPERVVVSRVQQEYLVRK